MTTENTDKEQQPEQTPWKSLGYESFKDFEAASKEREERARKQAQDRQDMIDRQADEIGKLRQDFTDLATQLKQQGDTPPAAKEETPPDTGDQYEKLSLIDLNNALTDDDRKSVDEMYSQFSQEEKQLVRNGPEAQAAFLRQYFRNQQVTSDSFFDRLPQPKQQEQVSLTKQIQALFGKAAEEASPSSADVAGIPGLSRSREELEARHMDAYKSSRQQAALAGGDLSAALAAMREGK